TDTIAFDVGGGGAQTIQPRSALPTITDHVVIDGTTQPGYAGRPVIVLNGSLTTGSANGLTITAGFSTVQGLVINGFVGHAIALQAGGSNVIAGNYLGTDVTGTRIVANTGAGILVESSNNLIGGTAPGTGNLISGNRVNGIDVDADITSLLI